MSESARKSKRVLSVGQCFADHSGISRVLRGSFGAEVIGVDSARQALEQLRGETFALVLVNRVFDADGSSGLDLIVTLQADDQLRSVPIMLVSNYEDAQAKAVQAGAALGFGKASLGQASMLSRLAPYLE